MPRLVISTVGTSLLTNQIQERNEKDWKRRINETANLPYDEVSQYYEDVSDIIKTLKHRAENKLYDDTDVAQIREASAE
ncbi:MAG: hypothetical protein PUP92_20125 [Rhizonema sp. PD38]|nr:hypothetical protein [Rhizonema sp. PD38]